MNNLRCTREDLAKVICCHKGCIFDGTTECLALDPTHPGALEIAEAIIAKYRTSDSEFTEWLHRHGEGASMVPSQEGNTP